ncbi:MAG: hypothetical protein A2X58_13155 [Nitrospirae bacterium GWC2_56_14]|nr:MAG: hypothetical protein A2X58_13155 [Nitrospirae bacterium GWC2_56_14]
MQVAFIPFVILGIALLCCGGLVIAIYNSLITVRNNVEKAFNNIDVVLQQRNDELTKLLDTVKGYMTHEKELLSKITELRTGYVKASDLAGKIQIENQMGKLLERLHMVWEQYPDLKAVQSFLHLQGRVSAVEEKIADYRETFNDAVNIYNIQIERFPDLLLARVMNFQRHTFLDVPEEKKEDVKMQFA